MMDMRCVSVKRLTALTHVLVMDKGSHLSKTTAQTHHPIHPKHTQCAPRMISQHTRHRTTDNDVEEVPPNKMRTVLTHVLVTSKGSPLSEMAPKHTTTSSTHKQGRSPADHGR